MLVGTYRRVEGVPYMGLIQKKDEKDVVDGIEVIGRGEGPEGLESTAYDLVAGKTAEDISGTTAAKDAGAETEADPVLLGRHAAPADDHGDRDGRGGSAGHGKLFAVIAVVAVIVAAIGGYFVGHGGFGAKSAPSATLTEDQLDTTVATWSYNGASHDLSARDAIESQYSLEAVKNSDGSYPAPTSDSILAYVRNEILLADAESRGISVSDDEMKEYAENSLGTSDFKTIAEQYGVNEDQGKEIVRQTATIQKLYSQIVPETSTAQPSAPSEPESGKEDKATKDYAEYIINLAGKEWDADKGTWASKDGTIASALADADFDGKTATYEQATTAYYAAYQKFSEASQEASSKWTEYANGLYAKASISIYGLYA